MKWPIRITTGWFAPQLFAITFFLFSFIAQFFKNRLQQYGTSALYIVLKVGESWTALDWRKVQLANSKVTAAGSAGSNINVPAAKTQRCLKLYQSAYWPARTHADSSVQSAEAGIEFNFGLFFDTTVLIIFFPYPETLQLAKLLVQSQPAWTGHETRFPT